MKKVNLKMVEDGFYGKVEVNENIFNKLNSKYFISHSDEKVKYMCANLEETEHLKNIGIEIPDDLFCDWFKILLK